MLCTIVMLSCVARSPIVTLVDPLPLGWFTFYRHAKQVRYSSMLLNLAGIKILSWRKNTLCRNYHSCIQLGGLGRQIWRPFGTDSWAHLELNSDECLQLSVFVACQSYQLHLCRTVASFQLEPTSKNTARSYSLRNRVLLWHSLLPIVLWVANNDALYIRHYECTNSKFMHAWLPMTSSRWFVQLSHEDLA